MRCQCGWSGENKEASGTRCGQRVRQGPQLGDNCKLEEEACNLFQAQAKTTARFYVRKRQSLICTLKITLATVKRLDCSRVRGESGEWRGGLCSCPWERRWMVGQMKRHGWERYAPCKNRNCRLISCGKRGEEKNQGGLLGFWPEQVVNVAIYWDWKTWEGGEILGWIQTISLDILDLDCSLSIQVKLSSRWLVKWGCRSERVGMHMDIWDLQTYKWHLKPWEWICSPRERLQKIGGESPGWGSEEFQYLEVGWRRREQRGQWGSVKARKVCYYRIDRRDFLQKENVNQHWAGLLRSQVR